MQNGIRCENLEGLTFHDKTFDLFITQDVMEHVFHPAKALKEIYRTLKPGGAHIFTAPKHADLADSRCRARLSTAGQIEYLLPEEYHGNPIGDGRALVTWDYGSDFERLASEWVETSVMTYNTVDRLRGLDAEFNEVFVIVKR
jgi:SAM-dependent methyltransferase